MAISVGLEGIFPGMGFKVVKFDSHWTLLHASSLKEASKRIGSLISSAVRFFWANTPNEKQKRMTQMKNFIV